MTSGMATEILQPQTITTHSDLLGDIEVPVDLCISFEHGLLGFPPGQRFVLLPAERDGVFWLQDVDDGALLFLVVDPFVFVDEYSFELPSAESTSVTTELNPEFAVLAIVTLPHGNDDSPTANLQAPLLVDFGTRSGWQVVLSESEYGTQHTIELALPTE